MHVWSPSIVNRSLTASQILQFYDASTSKLPESIKNPEYLSKRLKRTFD